MFKYGDRFRVRLSKVGKWDPEFAPECVLVPFDFVVQIINEGSIASDESTSPLRKQASKQVRSVSPRKEKRPRHPRATKVHLT